MGIPLYAGTTRDRLIGIGLMCVTLVLFSALDTTAKYVSASVPVLQVIWARYASNFVLVLLFVNPLRAGPVLRTKRPGLQLARALLLLGTTGLNFVALQYLQLAEATSIIFSTPLIVVILAALFQKDWVGRRRFMAILLGFVGVLVVTRPGFGQTHPAMVLMVGSAMCYAAFNLVTRALVTHDSPLTSLFYAMGIPTLVLTPILPFIWVTPTTVFDTVLLMLTGVFGGVGHYLLFLAHQRAPAPVLSPFIYTQILWMTGLGYLVFGDIPDAFTLVGAGIVIASGLYLLTLERGRAEQSRVLADAPPPSS